MMEEEWERPIGLTKEYAICVDDSDDSIGDGQPTKVNSKSLPKAQHEEKKNDNGSATADAPSTDAQEDVVVGELAGPPTIANDTTSTSKSQVMCSTDDADATTQDITDKPINPSTDAAKNSDNPFASFAFAAEEASASASSSSWQSRQISRSNKLANTQQHTKRKGNNTSSGISKKGKKTATKDKSKHVYHKDTMEEIKNDKAERETLIKKWQAFADPNAPLEQKRFQVLVAARLHARCQEPVVMKAMNNLREYFHESNQQLTVHSLASSDPEEIAPLLSSVLFGNTKAKHIVEASKDVLRKFNGRVPESMVALKDITGIGPTLSEILNIVNRVDSYKNGEE